MNFNKRVVALTIIPVLLFLSFLNVASAQTNEPSQEQIEKIKKLEEGLKRYQKNTSSESVSGSSCFDYYKFGSIDAKIFSSTETLVSGSTNAFNVEITNNNQYPVVGGQLYIKVYRRQKDSDLAVLNGDNLIDQRLVIDNISLKAGEQKETTFQWTVPAYAQTGEYYMVSYFTVSDRYNLLGLTFTDDIKGGVEYFKIVGTDSSIYIDKNNVTLNNQKHNFINPIPVFGESEDITAKIVVKNETNKDQTVNLVWDLYWWDSLSSENKLQTKTESMRIKANSQATASYNVTDKSRSVYFLMPTLTYQDSQSIVGIRFSRQGIDYPRVNYPAVTSYPLKAGEETTFFSCLHNTQNKLGNKTSGNVNFISKIIDSKGNLIHEYKYDGPVTGAMMGLSEKFIPKKDYYDFSIETELYYNGKKIDSDVLSYSCDSLSDNCPEVGKINWMSSIVYIVVGLVVLFLLLLFLNKKKNQGGNINATMMPMLVAMVVLFGSLFDAQNVFAQSAVDISYLDPSPKSSVLNNYPFYATFQKAYFDELFARTPRLGFFAKVLENVSVGVNYYAKVTNSNDEKLSNGDIVEVGDILNFEIKDFEREDIVWNGIGYNWDTPHGRWVDSFVQSFPTCDASDLAYGTNYTCLQWYDESTGAQAFYQLFDTDGITADYTYTPYIEDLPLTSEYDLGDNEELPYNPLDYFNLAFNNGDFGLGKVLADGTCIDGYGLGTFIPFRVLKPSFSISHGGTAVLECSNNGFTCEVKGAGTIDSTIIFSETSGLFAAYHNKGANVSEPGQCLEGSILKNNMDGYNFNQTILYQDGMSEVITEEFDIGDDFIVTVPEKTISINLTAEQPETSEVIESPTVTGQTLGCTGSWQSFTVTGDHPSDKAIQFGIDWTNNGYQTANTYTDFGTPNPNLSKIIDRQYNTPGTYYVSAITKDINGRVSEPSNTHSIQISSGPTLDFGSTDYNYNAGELAVSLYWTSQNASSCVLTSNDGLNQNVDLSDQSYSIDVTKKINYTLSCTSPCGSSVKTLTIDYVPPPAPVPPACGSAENGIYPDVSSIPADKCSAPSTLSAGPYDVGEYYYYWECRNDNNQTVGCWAYNTFAVESPSCGSAEFNYYNNVSSINNDDLCTFGESTDPQRYDGGNNDFYYWWQCENGYVSSTCWAFENPQVNLQIIDNVGGNYQPVEGPISIGKGESTSLVLTTSSVSSCSATNFSLGSLAPSSDPEFNGSVMITPTKDTVYKVKCVSAHDPSIVVEDEVSVNVYNYSAEVDLGVSAGGYPEQGPITITRGTQIQLWWGGQNLDTCWATDSTFETSGATFGYPGDVLTPQETKQYVIECSGILGDVVSDSVTVNVVGSTEPFVNLTASPSSISFGGSSTLTWTSGNVSACYPDQGDFQTNGSSAGSDVVGPAGTTEYKIRCTPTAGGLSVYDTATVSVADFYETDGASCGPVPNTLERDETINTYLSDLCEEGELDGEVEVAPDGESWAWVCNLGDDYTSCSSSCSSGQNVDINTNTCVDSAFLDEVTLEINPGVVDEGEKCESVWTVRTPDQSKTFCKVVDVNNPSNLLPVVLNGLTPDAENILSGEINLDPGYTYKLECRLVDDSYQELDTENSDNRKCVLNPYFDDF